MQLHPFTIYLIVAIAAITIALAAIIFLPIAAILPSSDPKPVMVQKKEGP